jgi:hypothetical protein
LKTDKPQPVPGGRQPWDYSHAAKAFHRANKHLPYTMYFNVTLEAQMQDKALPYEMRVLFAIQRFSWGNFSDFAVTEKPQRSPSDPKPRPMTQKKLAEILEIQESHISETVKFLKDQRWLNPEHVNLYPEKRVTTLESTNESWSQVPTPRNFHSPFVLFREEYIRKSGLEKTVSELEARRKQYQEAARKATKELKQIDLKALAAFREASRDKTEADDAA